MVEMTDKIEPRLVTLVQAADILNRSLDSVRRMIYAGELPVVRADRRGSKQWLDRQDLEEWIQKNKRFYTPPPSKSN